MRSKTLALLAVAFPVLVLAPPATAAPAVSPSWEARVDGNGGRDLANAVAVSPLTGHVYVVGSGIN